MPPAYDLFITDPPVQECSIFITGCTRHAPLHFRLCTHLSTLCTLEEQTLDVILLFMTVDVIVQKDAKTTMKQTDRTFQL